MKWILELSSWLNPAREKLGDVQIAPREFFLQMINLSQNQLQKYSRHYSLAWVLWRERFEDTVKDDFWNLICQEVSENPDSTMCNFSAQLPFLFNVNFSFFCKYKDFTADYWHFWPRVFHLQPRNSFLNVLSLQIWAIVILCNALIFKCCLSKSHPCRAFSTNAFHCTKLRNHWTLL